MEDKWIRFISGGVHRFYIIRFPNLKTLLKNWSGFLGINRHSRFTCWEDCKFRLKLESGDLKGPFSVEGDMEKAIVTLDKGSICSAWNYSGQRLAAGSVDGTLAIYDSSDPASSKCTCTSRFKVAETSILKIIWVPPEFGDAFACISSGGILTLWEEVVKNSGLPQWHMCKTFDRNSTQVLDIQFGVSTTSLKLVAAFADGHVKVFELLDPLGMTNWQLQAEFLNVIESTTKFTRPSCVSASISWNLQRGELSQSSFVLGFNSDVPQLNSSKVWEFDQDHQRWLPVAELALAEEKGDQVFAIAWSPNIGRPHEVIAVATVKGISIWHVGSNPSPDGRLSVERVALLSGHNGQVWQMEWDVSGMTLATTGSDGVVRLWQSNLNGTWDQQALMEPTA